MRLNGRVLFSFILLLLFIIALCFSINWSMKARLFPLVITVVGTMLALCLFISEMFHLKSINITKGNLKNEEIKSSTRLEKPNNVLKSEWIIILWVLGFMSLVLLFGFWLALVIFTPLFMSYFGRENISTSISFTVSIWMTIYLTFNVILKIPLYGGFLGLTW